MNKRRCINRIITSNNRKKSIMNFAFSLFNIDFIKNTRFYI